MAMIDATMVRGSANGTSRRRPFDRWLRYPAGFSQQALEACFSIIDGSPAEGTLIDPFCGVGTVGTAARMSGLGFVGIEAHPWIAKAAALKFKLPGPAQDLKTAAQSMTADLAPADFRHEHELITRAFDHKVLGMLVAIRERILSTESIWQDHLELALLSNLRSHAAVKVGWPYQLPNQPREPQSADPVHAFLRRVTAIADDLALWDDTSPSATVICGDSRRDDPWHFPESSSLIGSISSPPYLNNFDYADATRLELYFSGMVSTWKELCSDVRAGMVVASTQQTSVGAAEEALDQVSRWPGVRAHLSRTIALLEHERVRRQRGKEYSRVVAPYFLGVGQVLERLARSLPTGAPVVLVMGDSAPYGVYIDTPAILSAVGAEVGLTPTSIDPLRERGMRWRTNGTRHQVPLREALVQFRVAQ